MQYPGASMESDERNWTKQREIKGSFHVAESLLGFEYRQSPL
jgi:hypothetical protein